MSLLMRHPGKTNGPSLNNVCATNEDKQLERVIQFCVFKNNVNGNRPNRWHGVESCMDLTTVKTESQIEEPTFANPMAISHRRVKVRDVMSNNVATVSPNQNVADAALKMAHGGISCVIVTEKDAVEGILTETDLRRVVALQGDCIYQAKVADVMSGSVEMVSADLCVLDATKIMQDKHVRRLPVLHGKQLVGIVTQTDLTRALTSFGHWKDVKDIMSGNVCEIQTGASVVAAARLMNDREISSIVVMKDDSAVGVLTQKDILQKVIAIKKNPKGIKVEEVMSFPVISVAESNSVFSASKTMEDMNIRRLVVMEGKTVCGIVTQTDVCKAIEDKVQTEETKQYMLLQAGRAEAAAKILGRIEHVLDSAIVSATVINDMISQTDGQSLSNTAEMTEVHSPDKGTFPREKPQGGIISDHQTKLTAFKRELLTLVEEVIHIRNIIRAQQE